MRFLKNINKFRKKLMMGLTKGVGNSRINFDDAVLSKTQNIRILISRPNHRLGNQLLITPLIQEVIDTFPNCKIDLFVKGNIASILFKNFRNIDTIISLPKNHFKQLLQYIVAWLKLRKHHYEIVINVEKNSSSGRLSTKFASATYKFYGDDENDFHINNDNYSHIAKRPIYDFRKYVALLGIPETQNKIPPLDIKLSAAEILEGKKTLHNIFDNAQNTICLFTYATGAKCYSELWWLEFYTRLKLEYQNYNFIEVLPFENISQIAFKEPTFYSTEIREIGSVIANTAIFIGADSGIMHLASAVNTPTIGLFSVSNKQKYEPYNTNSQGIDTNILNINTIIKEIDKILLFKETVSS